MGYRVCRLRIKHCQTDHLAEPEEGAGIGPRTRPTKRPRPRGMTSRINTMLSIPMLFCMVAQRFGIF
jgi:uncharacterized membrane protein